MEASAIYKSELVSLCREEFRDNTSQFAALDEFQRNYAPERVLWWYTRDSFSYRMLNKVLRVQNIDVLFLFRFFIRDIYQQLQNYPYTSLIQVHRAQLISKDELDRLKRSINEFIFVNSFLSTSLDRQLALFFLSDSSPSDQLYLRSMQIVEWLRQNHSPTLRRVDHSNDIVQ